MIADLRKPFETLYLAEPMSGCWLWEGSTNEDGYGRFWNGHRRIGAHRQSWIEARGQIPVGLSVLHRCDNPACVNPNHLFLGTQLDNISDMKTKGRARNRPHLGEQHPMAILTESQVIEIRRRYAEGSVMMAHLGAEFGISRQSVSDVIKRKSWRHVL